MRPILISIGSIQIPSFFLAVSIGALLATFYVARNARKEGLKEVVLLDFGIIAILAGVVGARIFHVLVEHPSYYLENPIRFFYFWQGGFVSLGAFIASALGWFIYLKVKKLDVLRYLDVATTGVPIIIFFVRVGCLLAGCCFGKPCDLPWTIKFTNPGSYAYLTYPNTDVHPTQIYFMINAVIMFFVLHYVYKHRKFFGQVLAAFLMYYGITRLFIEFFRGDADRGVYFGGTVSTGQIVMLCSFMIGLILWMIRKKNV